MRKLLALFIFVVSITLCAENSTPVISPTPQQVTWGDKAFDNTQLPNVQIIKGVYGDKAVFRYKKLIPAQAEGYYLKVTPTQIVIAGRDADGLFYGEQTLKQITAQPEVLQCEVTDWPSVACRGVIEGFYGNPWSQQDRLRQFDFYGQYKMNTYVFGPKDDPYHRAHWREPYPEKEGNQLRELVTAAHKNHVQFVWAVHPGGDIQWNLKDSMAVVNKFEKMYELGIRSFAVFFDDIQGEGARAEKQAGLLNYVTDNFVHKHRDVMPLIICPTQYNKAWAGGDYLKTLGTKMYPEVRIMWTGNTVVHMIEKPDMEWVNNQINRKAFVWPNYPVNDYCQSHLIMGKFYGNGKDINTEVSGFCSNPMEYAEASKVALFSIADYTWNMPAYQEQLSWEHAIKALMPTCADDFRFFCINNIDMGQNGHGMHREGESADFSEQTAPEYFTHLSTASQNVLADSVNHPEMVNEIAPWLQSMEMLGRRGNLILAMQNDLQQNDSIAFVGHYRAQQQIEQAQKAIVSRDYEGSIVKAHPVVSGDEVTLWENQKAWDLIKQYKQHHTYGQDYFPSMTIDDGQYLIMANGKYLTDVNASPDRAGDRPVFQAERDNINPLRQQWNIEYVIQKGRFKITNVQDGRFINEKGTFWRSKDYPFSNDWNTFVVKKDDKGYTIQCAERAGTNFFNIDGDNLVDKAEPFTFQIVPVK